METIIKRTGLPDLVFTCDKYVKEVEKECFSEILKEIPENCIFKCVMIPELKTYEEYAQEYANQFAAEVNKKRKRSKHGFEPALHIINSNIKSFNESIKISKYKQSEEVYCTWKVVKSVRFVNEIYSKGDIDISKIDYVIFNEVAYHIN